MIIDDISNREKYKGANTGIDRALDYLGNTDFAALEDGKHPIEEEEIYALLMTYNTAPESERSFEAHRKYLDVQYILAGREVIYWAPAEELAAQGEYSGEKDIAFLSGDARARLHLSRGTFALFYPEDAHKPNCAWNSPQRVRKVVVKVRVG